MRRRWWLTAAVIPLAASAVAGFMSVAQASGAGHAAKAAIGPPGIGGGKTGLAAGYPFCKRLGKTIQASAAAQMYCFGAQAAGRFQPHVVRPATGHRGKLTRPTSPRTSAQPA